MFAPILNWMMGPRSPRNVDARRTGGAEMIAASEARQKIVQEIRELQIGIPREDRPELVDQVVHRFAQFVVDLPASERDHDAVPYGLLDHSLEVARAATRELVRPSFRVSEDPAANYREQPIWAYSGFVLGLLHDVGKVLDLQVVLREGGAPWDPLSEPLSGFLTKAGRTSSGPDTWRWTKGRGLKGHALKAETLVPLVLTPRALGFLGLRLQPLLRVFGEAYSGGREVWAKGPAGRVVGTVKAADKALSKESASSGDAVKAPEKKRLYVLPPPSPAAVTQAAVAERPDQVPNQPIPEARPKEEPASGHPAEKPDAESPPSTGEVSAKGHQPKEAPQPTPAHHRREREELIDDQLRPEKLMESVRSWIRAGNMTLNSTKGEVFVCQGYVWLRYPGAFVKILSGKGINWSPNVADRVLSALRKRPEVVPEDPRSAVVMARWDPNRAKEAGFVRFRASDFLPENELASLGSWHYEITVTASAIPLER